MGIIFFCQPTSACACSPDPGVQWARPFAWCVVWDHLPAVPIYADADPSLTPEKGGEVRSEPTNHKVAAANVTLYWIRTLMGRIRRN